MQEVEQDARNILCKEWKRMQEIFIARSTNLCTKYCVHMQDINVAMYGNITAEIACKK
jgi:hypothetical protein